MNNITISGRVGRDPELRTTANGKNVANLTVAVDRPFKDSSGERQTDWFTVTLWGQSADFACQYIEKGRSVVVSGRMESRKYDKDGTQVTVWDLVADRIEPIGGVSDNKPSSKPQATGDGEYDPFAEE